MLLVPMVWVEGAGWAGGVGEGDVSKWFDVEERGMDREASDIWCSSGISDCVRKSYRRESKDGWVQYKREV